jgi:hypothetical protein
MRNPFRYFKTSPEVIWLAVMMYIRFPLSPRQVEDLLHERGIDICPEELSNKNSLSDIVSDFLDCWDRATLKPPR